MCPFCQAQFPLRWEDSLEYRHQREQERAQRRDRLVKAWLRWSIVAAVVVLFGLVLLVVARSLR